MQQFVDRYDDLLVLLSVFVAVLSAYAAFDLLYSARFNEQRYMTLFELNPDLVLSVDPRKQRITSVNPAVLSNTGYTSEELMSLRVETLFWSQEDYETMLSAIRQASLGSPKQVEIRLRNRAGKLVIHSATVFPLEMRRHQLLYIISKDVTLQRLSEKELYAAKEAAESAARMKSEFLATMSHELRTPLNGIIGVNQLLAEDEEDEGRRELLALQSKSSHALLNVINDILDLSKMEAGKVKLVHETFSIRSLIEECYDLFEVISRDKSLVMRYYLHPDVPDTVIGDQMRLRQILINLVGNAIKFTDKGFVSLTVKKVGSDHSNFTLEFNVTDTGIGINPDQVELLFKPFSQLDGTQNRKYEGTGLGLAICRKLVEMMNGEIWVVPEAAQGAQFAFRIQLEKSEKKLHEGSGLHPTRECTSASFDLQLNVLLLDHDELNRKLVTHMLDKLGCTTSVYADAVSLPENVLQRGGYDLILININMPQLEALSWDQQPPEIGLRPYIAAMTTLPAEEYEGRPLPKELIDVYVEKPVDMKHLEDIVHSVKRLRHLPLNHGRRETAAARTNHPAVPGDVN